jgi:signal transduction histidine kinase
MMNQYNPSHLDSLLKFSNMHLLIFSSRWKLLELHPNHRSFLGWEETDISAFEFQHSFLECNRMNLEEFLGHFQQRNFVSRNYYWRNTANEIVGPFETYFRMKKEKGLISNVMAFVRLTERPKWIEFPPDVKQKIFLSELLPELIHQILNPLGSMIGQIELLQRKSPESAEYKQLLKLSHQLKSILQNLTYKITHERENQLIEINVNQLIQEEIKFLNTDSFFKQQVDKNLKFNSDLPKCFTSYISLSGIINEFYQFFKKLSKEDQIYVLQVETNSEKDNIDIYFNILGDFQIPDDLNLRFPVQLQGYATQLTQQEIAGIDTVFLSYCLKKNNGYLEITGRRELLNLHINIPCKG